MCWVIPPASPAATWVWRTAYKREVLPWSTCPITVITGGRSTRSPASSSSTSGASTSSSAAVTISILRSNCLAIDSTDSSVSVWVSVAISPSVIKALITSAAESPRLSATSRTVAPELTLIGGCSSGCFSSLSLGSSSSGRRRRPPPPPRGGGGGGAVGGWAGRRLSLGDVVAPRGLRIDHDASAALWRALARGAVAGAGSVGALRSRGLRAGSLGSVIRLRGCLLRGGLGGGRRGRGAVSGALQRRQRIRLLDTRLRGLGLDAGGLELGQELLARQALGLGDLVYSLLRHYSVVRSSLAVTVSAWGSPPSSDASAPPAAGSSSASATGASSASAGASSTSASSAGASASGSSASAFSS